MIQSNPSGEREYSPLPAETKVKASRELWEKYQLSANYFSIEDSKFELLETAAGPFIRSDKGELKLDFKQELFKQRQKGANPGHSLLSRALGLTKNSDIMVVDGTAGMGKDSALLQSFHPELIICERFLPLAALWSLELVNFIFGNCLTTQIPELLSFSVLYFDPMFAESPHKSQSRKQMEILKNWIAPEELGDEELCLKAQALGYKALVIKRHIKAPTANKTPNAVYKGKTVRYDRHVF